MIGYCDQAQGSNRSFYAHYRTNGGRTRTSTSRPAVTTAGAPGRPQLGAMSGDLAAAIK